MYVRRCFVADQLWFMSLIREVEEGRKTAIRSGQTLVVIFDIAHCSDRNTASLNDLFIRQHKLSNNSLKIDVVTASAGTLL